MRTGIFGGTFDPIHIGHLIVAEQVREKMELDRVIFIPARHPWLKSGRDITEGQHRLEMVSLAISTNHSFVLSDVEMTRPGPSYTVDTLEAMRKESGSQDEIYFIAGVDALAEMPRWKDPERIVALCHIVAVNRPGSAGFDRQTLEPLIPRLSSCMWMIDVPQIDISSTDIRERMRAGMSIKYMVTSEVEGYIHENGLYLSNLKESGK